MSLIGLNTGVLVGSGGKVCTPSSAGLWGGAPGSFSFSGDDIYGGHSTTAAIRTLTPLENDIDLTWLWTGGGAESVIGLMPTSADGSFTTGSSFAGMAGNGWFLFNNGSNIDFRGPVGGSTPEGNVSHNPVGNAVSIHRTAGAVTFVSGGSLIYTWDDASSGPVRIVIAYGNTGSATDWDDFIWCVG